MWWDHQNLDRPRLDKSAKRWNFRVWHDIGEPGRYAQRVFFWDDDRAFCGVVLLLNDGALNISRLHDLIEKLVADPEMREQHRRDLRFPLERHYSEYGVFPEELSK